MCSADTRAAQDGAAVCFGERLCRGCAVSRQLEQPHVQGMIVRSRAAVPGAEQGMPTGLCTGAVVRLHYHEIQAAVRTVARSARKVGTAQGSCGVGFNARCSSRACIPAL